MQKNVARMLCSLRMARTLGVYVGSGPSSNVRAIVGGLVGYLDVVAVEVRGLWAGSVSQLVISSLAGGIAFFGLGVLVRMMRII